MPTKLEHKLYGIIFNWLQTHEIGPACNEAVAKRLAQRIDTRLDQAGMVTKDGGKIILPE